MAVLMSSPMGPPARFDLFHQPSSPKFYSQHDDLPADFDKSFGSSMSISDSFDATHPGPVLSNPIFGLAQSLTYAQKKSTDQESSSKLSSSPLLLGAAMGTTLATRSPHLGASMISSRDMDISPAQTSAPRSPSQSLPRLMQNIHVGSSSSLRRDSAPRASSKLPRTAATGSAARLFGTELSLNYKCGSSPEHDILSSPDKEPPPKRRPLSLPVRQMDSHDTSASVLGGMSCRTRPALLSSLSGTHPQSSSQLDHAVNARQRLSGSHLPPKPIFQRVSPRAGSAQSFFDQASTSRTATHSKLALQAPEDDPTDELECNPSPSPSMSGSMAAYFYNPMSPEKEASKAKQANSPSLLAAMADIASSSPLGSSPCTRMPPPKRTTSLGIRTFDRTHTTALASRPSSADSASTTRTTLGKRANPYVKRPSLSNETRPTKSAYPVLGIHGQTTRLMRPTAPAPRRCYSSIDHSSSLAVEPVTSLLVAPASPERRRAPVRGYSEVSDANGSPIASGHRARPNFLRRISKDDSSPLGYGTGMKRSGSRTGDSIVDDLSMVDGNCDSSPASMPGFGASEKEGKVLPCFNVKDDGLMRISPQTVTELMGGKYSNAIASFQLVDCRFEYEYDGGHIPGAVNLNTVDKVIAHFLTPGQGHHKGQASLPPRSQSGKADPLGQIKKHVLVFHCEFSAKRAPSMALALRQADRSMVHDYPNCHYPEVYVLQGGYCDFFRTYSSLCEPQQYICMDDPRYHAKRSTELNGYRKQFLRHRSFTYGEGKRQQSIAAGQFTDSRCIQEEEAPIADTSMTSNFLAVPQRTDAPPVNVGDTSIGSVGDSSFEEGDGDSPCAAAGTRIMLLPPRIGSLGRRPLLRAGTTNDVLTRNR